MSNRYGDANMGSQPSAISVASATFLGPIAARKIGMSARNGRSISFSGFPSPVAPGPS